MPQSLSCAASVQKQTPHTIHPNSKRFIVSRLHTQGLVLAAVTPSIPTPSNVSRLHTQGLVLAADVDLAALATACHGYSGADLAALAREAAMGALTLAASVMLTDPFADIDSGATHTSSTDCKSKRSAVIILDESSARILCLKPTHDPLTLVKE